MRPRPERWPPSPPLCSSSAPWAAVAPGRDDPAGRHPPLAHGVKVNLKEYEGTGNALSLIEQSQPAGSERDAALELLDALEGSTEGVALTDAATSGAGGLRPNSSATAARTSASTCASKLLKFSWNIASRRRRRADVGNMRPVSR